jgi:hypothetical protein
MEAGARCANIGGRRRHASCLGNFYAKTADMISEFRPDLLALTSDCGMLNVENSGVRYIPHPITRINERGIICLL